MSTHSTELTLPKLIRESQRVREEFHLNVVKLRMTLQKSKAVVAGFGWPDSPGPVPLPATDSVDPHLLDGLTRREVEVLRLIAEGKSSKEVALELGMAFRTAVCHRYRIFQKLKVHETVTVVRLAVRAGLVRP